jgi:predicted nucleic acid-binding protein
VKRVFIDSDIFVRDLRYPNDAQSTPNNRFLKSIKSGHLKGVTSVFNLLEVCGILSFDLSPDQLMKLFENFTQLYNIQILYPATASVEFQYDIPLIIQGIVSKQALGDAQVSYVIRRFASDLKYLVTWNKPHFEDRLPIPVFTPTELP